MLPLYQQPHQDRPREKLLRFGSERLSLAELCAVVLGTGSRKHPLHILAGKVQRAIQLNTTTPNLDFLGEQQRLKIMAAIELGKRAQEKEQEAVLSPQLAIAHANILRTAKKEMIIGLYLDSRYRVIHQEVLAVGGLNQSVLLPRDLLLPLRQNPETAGIILLHNHPSGDPTPSAEDLAFTQKVHAACELLGLCLEDHLVVAGERWTSLREQGVLTPEKNLTQTV